MSEPKNKGPRKKCGSRNGRSGSKGGGSFLLQLEPEAMLVVELVDSPVQLPCEQFEVLLIDSECEV